MVVSGFPGVYDGEDIYISFISHLAMQFNDRMRQEKQNGKKEKK